MIMKKVLLLALLLVSVSATHAQWSITPEAGLATSKYANAGYDSWKPSVKIGAALEYDFTGGFALQSGLYYTSRGSSYVSLRIDDGISDNGYYSASYAWNRHYLQMPLMAKFSWEIADDVRLSAAAGPYAALELCKDTSGTIYYSRDNGYGYGVSYGYYPQSSNGLSKFDWGASLAVGVEARRWTTTLGYDVSLGRESDWTSTDINYHTISLSVGYKFKLGK